MFPVVIENDIVVIAMDILVITPAHDEEHYLGKCINSVKAAARRASLRVEHIVMQKSDRS